MDIKKILNLVSDNSKIKKTINESKVVEGTTSKKSLKDYFEQVNNSILAEAVPAGMKPMAILDPANKEAGVGVLSSPNPTIQKMLGGLDPKDVKIVMTKSTAPASTGTTAQTATPTAGLSTSGGATAMKEEQVDEKWAGDAKVEPTGQYSDKNIDELKSMLAKLKKSGPHELGSPANKRMKQIMFAIRAKKGWKGGVEETQINEKAKNPYAIGMASAMKSAGDKPPLKKSTIVKAHDIAKKIMKKEKTDEAEIPKSGPDYGAGLGAGRSATTLESKKVNESMNTLEAAYHEGKSHGLGGHGPNCRYDEGAKERHRYFEGYKEGLDECYGLQPNRGLVVGENVPSTVPGMADQVMPAMEADMDEGNAFTAALAKTDKGDKFSVGGKTFTDTSNYDAKIDEIKGINSANAKSKTVSGLDNIKKHLMKTHGSGQVQFYSDDTVDHTNDETNRYRMSRDKQGNPFINVEEAEQIGEYAFEAQDQERKPNINGPRFKSISRNQERKLHAYVNSLMKKDPAKGSNIKPKDAYVVFLIDASGYHEPSLMGKPDVFSTPEQARDFALNAGVDGHAIVYYGANRKPEKIIELKFEPGIPGVKKIKALVPDMIKKYKDAFSDNREDSEPVTEYAFESLDQKLNALLNETVETVAEGVNVSMSQGQGGMHGDKIDDSVSVSATGDDAAKLLAFIKQVGIGGLGASEAGDEKAHAEDHPIVAVASDYGAPKFGGHDDMKSLIAKVTGAEDEESEEEHACNECGMMESECGCEKEMVDEEETEDQMTDEMAEGQMTDAMADEETEAEEDENLSAKGGATNESVQLDEWANEAGKDGTEPSFERDIEFMTKVIAGGLNKPKSTGQTTIPVIAHQDARTGDEDVAAWKKLAGLGK